MEGQRMELPTSWLDELSHVTRAGAGQVSSTGLGTGTSEVLRDEGEPEVVSLGVLWRGVGADGCFRRSRCLGRLQVERGCFRRLGLEFGYPVQKLADQGGL